MAVCMYPLVILGCCSACLVYQMHDEYNYIGQAEWLDKPHLFLHCTLCTAVVVWLCKNIILSKVCIMQIKFTLRYEIATTIIKKILKHFVCQNKTVQSQKYIYYCYLDITNDPFTVQWISPQMQQQLVISWNFIPQILNTYTVYFVS